MGRLTLIMAMGGGKWNGNRKGGEMKKGRELGRVRRESGVCQCPLVRLTVRRLAVNAALGNLKY